MFQLSGWNPGGVSLAYRPQVQTFAPQGMGGQRPVTGGPMPVETPAPRKMFGPYGRNMQMPTIGGGDNFAQALDKLTIGMGMLRDQNGILPRIKAGGLGGLAKGRGAGTGQNKKFNEAAIAALLNFGAMPPGRGGRGRGAGRAGIGILGGFK